MALHFPAILLKWTLMCLKRYRGSVGKLIFMIVICTWIIVLFWAIYRCPKNATADSCGYFVSLYLLLDFIVNYSTFLDTNTQQNGFVRFYHTICMVYYYANDNNIISFNETPIRMTNSYELIYGHAAKPPE